jgi:stage IV sporulation protein FB
LPRIGAVVLGRFDGAPVRLRFGFFFAAAILTFPIWRTFRSADLVMAAIAAVILFLSILVHELAHAVVGRYFDVPIRWIEINVYGGLVNFLVRPKSRPRDFAITIAGPAANLALGCAALLGLQVLTRTQPSAMDWEQATFVEVLRMLAYVNLGLCIVNLLPGFPLDGGRLLYLLLDGRLGHRAATRVVGGCGTFFAAISTLVLIVTAISGFPIWSPPEFRPNWKAVRSAGRSG